MALIFMSIVTGICFHFPRQVQRLLPIIINNTQSAVAIEGFGNLDWTRERFKKVVRCAKLSYHFEKITNFYIDVVITFSRISIVHSHILWRCVRYWSKRVRVKYNLSDNLNERWPRKNVFFTNQTTSTQMKRTLRDIA